MTEVSQVTLEDMLLARDHRQARQYSLAAHWPDSAIVVLTVVAPGSEKRNYATSVVARAASDALADAFASTARYWAVSDLPTGFELWIVSSLSPQDAKRRAVAIEETHPLGRMMDIDVIGADLRPLSRQSIGFSHRNCLVCGDDARVCMRSGRHSYSDIIQFISDTVDAYVSEI